MKVFLGPFLVAFDVEFWPGPSCLERPIGGVGAPLAFSQVSLRFEEGSDPLSTFPVVSFVLVLEPPDPVSGRVPFSDLDVLVDPASLVWAVLARDPSSDTVV